MNFGWLTKIKKWLFEYVLPVLCGVVIFLSLYGITPLDITNDAWIMAGYDESDLIQHYAGWVAFRSSNWAFPLGIIEGMADGTGTMLSFTDSIPIVAIFFKAIDFLLPETFQYFGWYTLLCFVLQALAGYMLIRRKCEKPIICYAGTVLFLLSPILWERAFRHTALASHWFVLFALLIYLNARDSRKEGKETFSKGYVVLNVLTVLIHPYFLPMVMIFTALTAWENILKFRHWIKNGAYVLGNAIAAYSAGWLIGALGWDIESSRFGYGYFSMNLNALVNPSSLGAYKWSQFLPVLSQTSGNYDGFNYLGVGALILLVITVVLGMRNWIFYADRKQWLKENIWLLLGIMFLTAFSITNIITLNEKEVLNIPIPWRIYSLCGIFRASGRIFYPVFYVIYTYIIYRLIEIRKRSIGIAILVIGIVVQMADLSSVIVEKHQMMDANSSYESLLDNETLLQAATGRKKVILSGMWDIVEMRRIAVWAGKNGMNTSFSVANSGVYSEAEAVAGKEIRALESGEIDKTIIYATQDVEVYKKWLSRLDESEITKYYYNDYYYIIPNLE